VTVPDLFCTFCKALGIDPRFENQSNVGRPLKVVETGKAVGEVVRRAQAAKTRVAVVAGKVDGLVGLHALDGEGRVLDAAGISALAERVVREAFGLPGA